MEIEEEGLVVRGRVVIDTRQPFRSVKEAVSLFGETVLAGEIYGHMIKQVQYKASENAEPTVGLIATELEETKQSLQKAKEEGIIMANCFNSLKQELEETKKDIKRMKSKQVIIDDPEFEEKPFVSEAIKPLKNDGIEYIGKKKCVKFASPNLLDKDMKVKKKTLRKFLMPFSFGGIFSKKKGSQQRDLSPRQS